MRAARLEGQEAGRRTILALWNSIIGGIKHDETTNWRCQWEASSYQVSVSRPFDKTLIRFRRRQV